MILFWMDSFDHGEDWFVVSQNPAKALNFFASEMGYDEIEDGITALEVCVVPDTADTQVSLFANEAIIKNCGGELVEYDNADLLPLVDREILEQIDGDTRIVKIDNTIFVEGSVTRAALYAMAHK